MQHAWSYGYEQCIMMITDIEYHASVMIYG